MKRRPVQYLALLMLLLASLVVIFFPIVPRPEPTNVQVPLVSSKPFVQLVAKGKNPVDEADAAFVAAFKGRTIPGALVIGADGKSATVADSLPVTTRAEAQNRAEAIVSALSTRLKGVSLAPSWSQTVANLPGEPLLPLGAYVVDKPRQREGQIVPAVKLGLDLQGGVNLVLQIRRAQFPYRLASVPPNPAAREELLTRVRAALASSDSGLNLRGTDVAFSTDKSSPNQFEIRTQARDLSEFNAQEAALDALVQKIAGAGATPGRAQFYDAGGESGQKAGFGSSGDYSSQLLDRTVEILRSRVDKLGVSEPLIQKQLPDRVIVQLPGVNDPQKAVQVVGQTAQLRIVLLPQDLRAGKDPADPNNTLFTDAKTGAPVSGDEALERCEAETGRTLQRLGLDKTGAPQPIVSGQDVKPTSSTSLDEHGQPAISFELQGEGSSRFAAVTRDAAPLANTPNPRQIPIFLDQKCVSAPTVNSTISGQGQISGGFKTIDEAKSFALLLNSGALPAPIDVVENRTVSATLGNDSLVKSLRAGFLGLIAVAIFMVVFYRLPGLLANCALAVYCVLNLALFVLIGGTLTLPGIAGFLLALAMSLDTNILVFERLKEEMAIQPTFSAALRAAFNRAWTAILDSHVTTLIASVVLFYFGTGPVKGFALTLGVGVLLSLFSAISVTRLFMWSVAGVGERNRKLMAARLPAPHQPAGNRA
jgi:preprotein translocase subunit SecD